MISIVNTQRVTAGLSPRFNFKFSDGVEIQTKSDGFGCQYENEVYQILISNWFNKK